MTLFRLLGTCCLLVSTAFAAPALRVDETISPNQSYWGEHVHYPYPVQIAPLKDRHGRQWEIAYMDAFHGDDAARKKAPTLVLLHGRGMHAGAWGELMEAPLQAGRRVISIDWGHSGKSLPRNLRLPANASLDDARDLIFQLVVKQLGIARADYLGHSLGGQVAAGYALRYPQHVSHLVLYASGGLESIPESTLQFLGIADPAVGKDESRFLSVWREGKLPAMGNTPEAVQEAYYQSRPGKLPYMQKGDPVGGAIALSRAQALRGNAAELLRYQQVYAWHSAQALLEGRQDDEDALPNRITRIKPPTLLLLGLKDPAFPMPGSGNTQLVADVVQPLYVMARSRKMPLQIKLYENAGHFIHTDLPQEMSRDVLSFLKQDKVAGPLYAGDPERYLPPARVALSSLPAPVAEFKQRWEKALLDHNMADVRALLHPELKHNGRNLQEHIAFFQSFIDNVTRWELATFSADLQGPEWILEVETRNDFGTHPDRILLREYEGSWRLFGNRR